MLISNIANQLIDDNRLTDARAAKNANLATLGEGRQQVDGLDPRLKHLDIDGLIQEARRQVVDRQPLAAF